jgi:ribosome maturation factor RimP
MTSMQAIIELAVSGLGYEVVDVEHAHDGLLRVYIDAPAGIGLDDCEKVSRQLSHVLAVEDVDYTRLEVSSPGLDRPLKKPADFERFAGNEVSVRLRRALEGRRNFEGVLTVETGGRYGLELIERPSQEAAARGRKAAPKTAASKSAGSKKAGPKAGVNEAAGSGEADAASHAPRAAGDGQAAGRKLVFALDEIERARLVPKLKFQERRK